MRAITVLAVREPAQMQEQEQGRYIWRPTQRHPDQSCRSIDVRRCQ
jgi:hypothetical protein